MLSLSQDGLALCRAVSRPVSDIPKPPGVSAENNGTSVWPFLSLSKAGFEHGQGHLPTLPPCPYGPTRPQDFRIFKEIHERNLRIFKGFDLKDFRIFKEIRKKDFGKRLP